MSKTMTFLRKNQKLVFSVLCVVLVVTWGLSYSADQLMNLGGGAARNPANDVVLTWVGGQLTQHELELRRRAHFNAVRYVFAVMQKAQEAQGTPAVPMLDQGAPIPPSNDSQTVIDIMLRAEKARRLGVRVNEEAVKQFLMRLSGDVLREGDLGAIARETLGQEMSDHALMEQLQEELLSQQMRLLAVSSLTTLSLGDDWEYFCRLNRRMHIAAYGLDVDKFKDEVKGQPSVKDLRTLFDKHKDNDPDPNSSEPGFRNLRRVAWEYLKIDFTPHLEAAKKEITDEQIKKYYDEAIAKGEFKAKPPEETDAEKKDTDKKDTDTKDGEKADGDKKDAEAKDGDKKDAPASDKPAGETKDADKKDSEKPAESKPADEKPAEKKADDKKADDKPAEGAAAPQSDEVTAGDPSAKQAAAPSTDQKTQTPAETKSPEAKPEEKPATDKPADDKKPTEDKPTTDKPADDKPADKEAKPAEETKFKPLEEVRDEIVTILARPVAQDALNKDVQQLIDALKSYKVKQRRYEDAQKIQKAATTKATAKKKVVEPPGEFDAAALAKKLGAEHVTTPLVNRYELADEELGREGMIFFREAFQFVPFADAAYSRQLEPYEPMDVFFRGGTETKVIVWPTKEVQPEQVKFDDKQVHERLVAAWTKQQAVALARKAAEAIAAEAKDKDTLEAALPEGAMVIKPAPFSWLTGGAFTPAMGARVSLSQVEGIELAGPEFMQAVSRLNLGETGVAINHSHSRVYVVRLLQQEPSEEELRERFLESGSSMAVRSAAGQDVSRLAQQWEQQMADELKVVYRTSLQTPTMDEQ